MSSLFISTELNPGKRLHGIPIQVEMLPVVPSVGDKVEWMSYILKPDLDNSMPNLHDFSWPSQKCYFSILSA